MIFLIEYDPPGGHILTFKKFEVSDRSKAHEERLAIELDLFRRGVQHEVLLLEAECEEDIRLHHQRFFETPEQILRSMRDNLENRGDNVRNS